MGVSVVIPLMLAAAAAGQRQVDIVAGKRPDQPGGYTAGTDPPPQGKATIAALRKKYGEGGTYSLKAHHLMGRKTEGEQGRSILTKNRIAEPMAPNRKKLTPT